MRNAAHKARQARLFTEAPDDSKRLAAAYDWFRTSAALLGRRRPSRGIDPEEHRAAAARLIRDMTDRLAETARAIDRGDYDAKGAA